MGLLIRRTRPTAPTPADIAQWRGRSRALPDAGAARWELLMAALETAPGGAWPMGGLGLERADLGGRALGNFDVGGDRYFGLRYGRQVEVRMGLRDHGWSGAGAMVTWLRVATEPWRSEGSIDGRLAVDAAAPSRVAGALAALTPAPVVWHGVILQGGPEGIVAFRKITGRVHPQGYLYDLWLAERLADVLAAPALPPVDVDGVRVPYGLGRLLPHRADMRGR